MKVNFQRLIKDLQRKGWTQEQLSAECGLSQSVISRLQRLRGAEPRYNAGARLVELSND